MIVLLGNTGSRYERTRHNVARRLLEADPLRDCSGWQRKFKADWAKCTVAGNPMVVLLPLTMMNLSGESVQAAARFFRYSPQEIVVAHDDTELEFGYIDIKSGGGLAGHNGLKSVAHCLADRSFYRLRIGVGRPAHGELHGHVLGRFSAEEEAELPDVAAAANQLLPDLCSGNAGSKPVHFSDITRR
jgi:PTH1 family peptidyl-tRNA hydrolase